MFKFLYESLDKDTKKPLYFMIMVKGKTASWLPLDKEQFEALKSTVLVIK